MTVRFWVSLISAALLMVPAGDPARGQADPASPEASPGAIPGAPPRVTREQAVATVLATDPRFPDLADYETLRQRGQADFRPHMLDTSYYRVLPDVDADLELFGVAPRLPASWLISVVLVADCVEPSSEVLPLAADPCAWRHSWTYRVAPDASLTLLFDEGDPGVDGPVPGDGLLPLAGTM